MSNLAKLGSEMGQAFRRAREENEESRKKVTDPPVDGTYEVQIQNCVRQSTKAGDGQYILTEYYFTSGEYTGKVEYNRLMLIPERLRAIESFFSSFGFDTTQLCCNNPDEIIDDWCLRINQAHPSVRILTKRWFRKDETGNTTTEIGGCNIYIKAILDDNWSPESGVGSDSKDDDGLDKLDKKALRELILDEDLDISMKFWTSHSEQEIIAEIRKQRSDTPTNNEPTNNKDDGLLTRLLEICEAQGITESEEKEGVGDIKELSLSDLVEVMKSYTFESVELTPEEINVLIDGGLDQQINYPPSKKEEKKTAAKKTAKK